MSRPASPESTCSKSTMAWSVGAHAHCLLLTPFLSRLCSLLHPHVPLSSGGHPAHPSLFVARTLCTHAPIPHSSSPPQPARPTYQQLEDALRALPSASINKSVAQRIQEEFYFNRDTLDQR